jgi:4-hydroxy-tetrahydrodipicolinate synthase
MDMTGLKAAASQLLLEAGVHGLTSLGSTDELTYLDRERQPEIVNVVVQAARGRLPVITGVAATTIQDGATQANEDLFLSKPRLD